MGALLADGLASLPRERVQAGALPGPVGRDRHRTRVHDRAPDLRGAARRRGTGQGRALLDDPPGAAARGHGRGGRAARGGAAKGPRRSALDLSAAARSDEQERTAVARTGIGSRMSKARTPFGSVLRKPTKTHCPARFLQERRSEQVRLGAERLGAGVMSQGPSSDPPGRRGPTRCRTRPPAARSAPCLLLRVAGEDHQRRGRRRRGPARPRADRSRRRARTAAARAPRCADRRCARARARRRRYGRLRPRGRR